MSSIGEAENQSLYCRTRFFTSLKNDLAPYFSRLPLYFTHPGNVLSKLNIGLTRNITSNVTKITPTIFKKNPALAILIIGTRPELKTMALGGVPAGIIKAQEAEIVAGIINNSGWICPATAIAAKTGSNNWVMAVLLVNSVRKVIKKAMTATITIGGRLVKPLSCFPTQIESPDC